jgi:hypothetical protein
MSDVYEEMLRADRAELALTVADQKLARVLEMADAWEARYGGGKINAGVAAGALRRAVRGLEFTP